jgi:hypothetical protein
MARCIMRHSPVKTAAIWPQIIMVMVNMRSRSKPPGAEKGSRAAVEGHAAHPHERHRAFAFGESRSASLAFGFTLAPVSAPTAECNASYGDGGSEQDV